MTTPVSIKPFTISVSDQDLNDLRNRLLATRWPDAVAGAGWDHGTDIDYLRGLVDYWINDYDWRAAEQSLNQHQHLLVDVDGLPVHVVRQTPKSSGAATLLLLHGWPDSFLRFHKLLPRLAEFDVVVPSLPGFGFSQRPAAPGVSTQDMADIMARLMTNLGVDTYFVHGGDVGTSVGDALARHYPSAVRGLHLTDLVHLLGVLDVQHSELTDIEKTYVQAGAEWQSNEGAYWHLQHTKPQTAAVALNDSPAGLASWIVEKFRSWSDCGGDIESRFTRDELLTNLTIYWATQTIGSTFRVYFETTDADRGSARVRVPTGFAIFPHDLVLPPRELAERFFEVVHWSPMPRGGHFAALEEPDLLADDLKTFIRNVAQAPTVG